MDKLSHSQQQRLYFIDFRLMFFGSFTRSEVVNHFRLGLSAATRDINLYKEYAPHNLSYDNADKRYFKTDEFNPVFPHDNLSTMMQLSASSTDENNIIHGINLPFEAPSQLVIPDVNTVAVLTQAILGEKAVDIEYVSLSSGQQRRTIIPHSLIDNGLRWHVRAFDCESNTFKDFVMTRIITVNISSKAISEGQKLKSDQQWIKEVKLELVPHPKNIKYAKAIELDYGMENGCLILNTKAALAGYILRRWNVDCTEDASQQSPAHQLWLKNRSALKDVNNIQLASGTEPSNQNSKHELTTGTAN